MNNSFQKLTVLFHCSVCCGPLPWNVTGCCQPELMRSLWQAWGCRTVFQRHFSPAFASTSLTRSGFWLKKWILKVCPVSFKHRADPVHLKLEHFFFPLSSSQASSPRSRSWSLNTNRSWRSCGRSTRRSCCRRTTGPPSATSSSARTSVSSWRRRRRSSARESGS